MSFENYADQSAPHAASPGPTIPEATPKAQVSVGTLFAAFTTQVRSLIEDEIRLAKTKFRDAARSLSSGAVILAIAGVLALYALGWGLHTGELALRLVLPQWAAALIVCVVLLLVVALLTPIGLKKLKEGSENTAKVQQEFKDNMAGNVDILKKGLSSERD
ncbi:phage holin family protein [Schaalia suimastitidis]|uniref:phage holin family protein n=1 Tax=Schaalia suimastitidis TaxID=121163 RepID=UPI0003FD897A|nr:phage holin family protein [Schaalia suimastitidis]